MKKPLAIALASLLFCSTLALASGSSGAYYPAAEPDPYTITKTTKCKIVEIRADGTIIVEDKEQRLPLALTDKTELRAQKPINGRKKLEVSDLAVGQRLKVTMRQIDGKVVRVKVLKPA